MTFTPVHLTNEQTQHIMNHQMKIVNLTVEIIDIAWISQYEILMSTSKSIVN